MIDGWTERYRQFTGAYAGFQPGWARSKQKRISKNSPPQHFLPDQPIPPVSQSHGALPPPLHGSYQNTRQTLAKCIYTGSPTRDETVKTTKGSLNMTIQIQIKTSALNGLFNDFANKERSLQLQGIRNIRKQTELHTFSVILKSHLWGTIQLKFFIKLKKSLKYFLGKISFFRWEEAHFLPTTLDFNLCSKIPGNAQGGKRTLNPPPTMYATDN